MSLAVVDVYNVRFGPKLSLPRSVQDNIGRLRITPVAYKPVRNFVRNGAPRHRNSAVVSENWREKALVEMVRRVREREDPEYSDIFSIFNKITMTSVDKLSHDAIDIIQKKDEQFRLRVTTLLFDKAITQSAFSSVMAECAYRLNIVIPEIADDLQTQISMFPKLYDISDTITFPQANEDGFEDKVVSWMKQKDKRRGYAKFMMELFVKGLIPESLVQTAFEQVVKELNQIARYPASERTIENTTQFVEFLFECSKTAKSGLKECLKTEVQSLLKTPKSDLPSLNMRCKFKLEDALKLLEKKDQE
jgi:hypothetical protein